MQFERDGWFQVAKEVKPAMTRAEFDLAWDEFQEMKMRRRMPGLTKAQTLDERVRAALVEAGEPGGIIRMGWGEEIHIGNAGARESLFPLTDAEARVLRVYRVWGFWSALWTFLRGR